MPKMLTWLPLCLARLQHNHEQSPAERHPLSPDTPAPFGREASIVLRLDGPERVVPLGRFCFRAHHVRRAPRFRVPATDDPPWSFDKHGKAWKVFAAFSLPRWATLTEIPPREMLSGLPTAGPRGHR
jgi:hypothetical protein